VRPIAAYQPLRTNPTKSGHKTNISISIACNCSGKRPRALKQMDSNRSKRFKSIRHESRLSVLAFQDNSIINFISVHISYFCLTENCGFFIGNLPENNNLYVKKLHRFDKIRRSNAFLIQEEVKMKSYLTNETD